ncbi:MAG: PolC-type DNA polymerase III [Candidatus Gracilibacteria bacterium]
MPSYQYTSTTSIFQKKPFLDVAKKLDYTFRTFLYLLMDMLEEQIFTIFDTETTGFNAQSGDKIIEIAAIKMQGGKIIEGQTFDMLVNPERAIPFESTQVNKITDDMVKDAPTIGLVLPQFMDFIGDSILVAHNAEFDMAFLNEALFMTNPFAQAPEAICTKILSRKLNPNEKFHNLDTLTYRYKIEAPAEGRHRALTDVYMLAKVFEKLLEEARVTTVDELKKLAR